jgi:hypothetical protein
MLAIGEDMTNAEFITGCLTAINTVVIALMWLSDKRTKKLDELRKEMREGFYKIDEKFERIALKIDYFSEESKESFHRIDDCIFDLGKEIAALRGAKQEAERREALEIQHIEYQESPKSKRHRKTYVG